MVTPKDMTTEQLIASVPLQECEIALLEIVANGEPIPTDQGTRNSLPYLVAIGCLYQTNDSQFHLTEHGNHRLSESTGRVCLETTPVEAG